MSAPSPTDLKALETIRQKLSYLTTSIQTLERDLASSETLPPWPHLASLLSIIASNLSTLAATQAAHGPLLSALAVYPLPSYPGRTHGDLLQQLLRKKLEPGVEDWADRGLAEGTQSAEGGADELADLWRWAGGAANEQARGHLWGGDYTRDEVDAGVADVVTGLRRRLVARRVGDEESSEESSEEEGGDEMDLDAGAEVDGEGRVRVRRGSRGDGVEFEVAGPGAGAVGGGEGKGGVGVGDVARYWATGVLPRGAVR